MIKKPISKNIEITPKIIPLSNMTCYKEKKEKKPEDSVKKNIVKKKLLNTQNNKTLKCSMSSKILNSIKKPIFDRYDEKSKKSVPHNSLSKKKFPVNTKKNCHIILNEFIFGKQIGKGTFGKIFSVKWSKNNKCYAMKREILTDFEDVQKRKSTSKIIQSLTKNNENKGVIKLYGNLCLKKNKYCII